MALREILARFAFKVDPSGLKKADKGIAGVVGKLQGLGVALGAGVVASGIKNFITDMVDAGDAIGKTSTQLGLSAEQLQAWQAAAGFAGVEGEKFNQSMRVLQKNTLLADQGSKQASDAFDMLGVSIKDASGNLKTGDQLMREVGLALNGLENSTEKVAIAQQLMGRSGAALLPLFKDGEAGLDATLRALDRFGGGLSKDLIPLAEAAQDRFAEWEIATTSLKSRVMVALLPMLNSLVLSLSKAGAAVSKFLGKGEAMKAILIVLGGVLAKLAIGKFGMSLLKLGRAAALPLLKIALLVLLVEDLIVLFKGGDSLIGRFLDKLFGAGSSGAVVKAITDITSAVKKGDWGKVMKKSADALDALGKSIVTFFSGESTGPIAEFFSQVGAMIVAFVVEDIPEAFSQLGFVMVSAIVDGVKAIVGTAGDWLAAAVALAEAFIDGLVQGIKDGAAAVVGAVKGVAKDAINSAKKALKIGSPSKKAEDEVGVPFLQGAFPIKEAMSRAKQFAGTVSQAVPTGLGGGGGVATAAGRGAGLGGGRGGPVAIFKSEVHLTVNGGSASDPQIQKLRQGVRSELRDNRRATLAALEQAVEVG